MPDRLGAARLTARRRPAGRRSRRPELAADRRRGPASDAEVLGGDPGPVQPARPGGRIRRPDPAGSDRAGPRAGRSRPGAWSSRLGLHVHLPPLDLDEARELLGRDGRLTEPELEELHRDALGNPRAMRRIAEARASGLPAGRARRRPAPGRPAGTFRLPRAAPGGEARLKGRPDRTASPAGPGSRVPPRSRPRRGPRR